MADAPFDLSGKVALVTGVATRESLAWGIARAFHREGARLVLTHPDARLGRQVAKLAPEVDAAACLPCDVRDDAQIEQAMAQVERRLGGLDVLVHAIAHAPREALRGDFLSGLSREAWNEAHETSAYSLAALARAARPLLARRGGAILTLSYLGAERTVAGYNVMGPAKASLEAAVRYLAASLGPEGIRVNALSAGPVRTLAARGIEDLPRLLAHAAETAPLRRNVTAEEVGDAALLLCSELASAITGEVVHVDAGLHAVALPPA